MCLNIEHDSPAIFVLVICPYGYSTDSFEFFFLSFIQINLMYFRTWFEIRIKHDSRGGYSTFEILIFFLLFSHAMQPYCIYHSF